MDDETINILAQVGSEAMLYALAASADQEPKYAGMLFSRIVFEGETEEERDRMGFDILEAIKPVMESQHVDYFDVSPVYLPNGVPDIGLYVQQTMIVAQAMLLAMNLGSINVDKVQGVLFVRMVVRAEDQPAAEKRIEDLMEAVRDQVVDGCELVRYGDCYPMLAAEAYIGAEDGEFHGPASGMPDQSKVKRVVSVDETGMSVDESLGEFQRELRRLLEESA